jgi:hypothetical protein
MATFDHLILNGRPAGGKSELIDFLKEAPLERREERYHVGEIVEMDDFVWLWEKFVEDDLWEALGEPRLYSRRVPDGYVQKEGDRLLEMLLLKMSRIVERDYLTRPAFYGDHTLFIEFARGVFDGGYRKAFELLSKPLLSRAAVLYIQVSFEESCRKNEARYQEKLAHSILAHKLPDEALERFSREQDFEKMVGGERSGYFELQGLRVPFVVMPNEPELKDPDALDVRYGEALRELMRLYEARA